MPIAAHLSTGAGRKQRGLPRRELRLRTQGRATGGGLDNVSVLNLSASGLLIETHVQLAVGDELMVDLPESGMCRAKVVWASDGLFGCAFDRPVSDHVVSAALLRSEPIRQDAPDSNAEENSPPPQLSGSDIRRLRLRKGMSLVDFAHQMGVSRPAVWAWESEKSSPRVSKLARLFEILDVRADDWRGLNASSVVNAAEVDAEEQADTLASAIIDAKDRVARIAGTTPNHIKVIIEL